MATSGQWQRVVNGNKLSMATREFDKSSLEKNKQVEKSNSPGLPMLLLLQSHLQLP